MSADRVDAALGSLPLVVGVSNPATGAAAELRTFATEAEVYSFLGLAEVPPELADLLEESPPIDRTTINAWEDADFLAAHGYGPGRKNAREATGDA